MKTSGCKRLVALCLSFSMVWGMASLAFASEESEPTPNQDLLEAMLSGERKWVIDTLVDDDWSTNPMAIAQMSTQAKSLAKEAHNHYYGINPNGEDDKAAYRTLVNAMYFVYNTDEYTQGFFDELGELVSWVVGLFTGEEIRKTAETLNRTRHELHYDNLLKSVFTENYTASDGTSVLDEEASLVMVKQLQKAAKYCKSFTAYAKSNASTITNIADRTAFTTAYIDEYALPYGDAAEKALNSLGKLAKGGSSYNDEATAQLAANLAIVARLAGVSPQETYQDFSYTDYLGEYLEETGVADLIKLSGKPFEIADTALENYLYLESIQAQRDTISGPLTRLAQTTGNTDLKQSVNNFERMMREEYNRSFLSWDSIQTYLRNNRVVGKYIGKASEGMIKKTLHLTDDYMLGAAVAKATEIVGISAWISDQAIGLKEICAKTFELLYWEDLTGAAKSVYYSDLAAYQNSKNEETAGAVLDDLMLLQRLRLYGEKIAYGIGSAPNNTWLGWFIDGEQTQEAWDTLYQLSVDILMAASVVPPLTGLNIGSGETMMIEYINGAGFVARCNGRYYVDLPIRLSGGITSAGTLLINASDRTLGVGYVDLGASGSMRLSGGTLEVGEFTQKGGILSLGETANIVCTERLCLGNPTINYDGELVMLSTHDLELSGKTSCSVVASGDVSGSGGVAELRLNGATQTVSGTVSVDAMTVSGQNTSFQGNLTAGALRLNGSNVSVTGNTTVTGSLYGPSTAVTGGKNILLSGGTLVGGTWNGDLTVQNATVSGARFSGSVYDSGGTIYRDTVTINGRLNHSGLSTISSGAEVTVCGAASFSGGLAGMGKLRLKSDLILSESPTLNVDLILDGNASQDVSGEFTVVGIRFANTSKSGINLLSKVTVTGFISNPIGRVSATTPIHLDGNAYTDGSYHGPASALNWSPKFGSELNGDLALQEGGTLSGGSLKINGALTFSGTGTVNGCEIIANGLHSDSSLTLINGGKITAQGAVTLGGTLNNAAALDCLSDVSLNSLTATGLLSVRGDLNVSGTTKLDGLSLDGIYRQEVTGSAFEVRNLLIRNTSGKPVKLAQTITVTGSYDNPDSIIDGGSVQSRADVDEWIATDTIWRGNHYLNSPLMVRDCTLTVDGVLTAPSVALENAKLIVNGSTTVSGTMTLSGSNATVNGKLSLNAASATHTIDETSVVLVNGELSAVGGTVALKGSLNVRGDAILNTTAVTGGTLKLGGDLTGSGVIRPSLLHLNGLTPQIISATDVHVGDLSLENSSRNGVVIESNLYYSGILKQDGIVRRGESRLIKENN